MGKTKIVALRMSEESLKIISAYCGNRPYLNRSQVVNRIVDCVLACASEETLHNLIEVADPYSAGWSVQFTQVIPKN